MTQERRVGPADEWHWLCQVSDLGNGWSVEWWYRIGEDGRVRGGRYPWDLPVRGRVFRDVRQWCFGVRNAGGGKRPAYQNAGGRDVPGDAAQLLVCGHWVTVGVVA